MLQAAFPTISRLNYCTTHTISVTEMSQTSMKKYLPFLILPLFLGACDLDSLKEPIIISNIEKEFNLDLWEHLNQGNRSAQLLIETISLEDCENYSIDYHFIRSSSKLEVSLNEIVPPQDCTTGEAPAQSIIDLGNLQAGLYDLNIDLKNTVFNEGTLAVTDESFTVNMTTDEGIIFVRRELLRVPNEAIWGYIGVTDIGQISIVEDFITDLEQLSTLKDYKSGYYGYFSVNTEKKVNMADLPFAAENMNTFVYQYAGEETALQELVDSYRTNYGALIEIKLTNTQGKTF